MRTTLKKAIGRGAAANGDGRAVLPPLIASPVTRYTQPREERGRLAIAGRILFWTAAALVMLVASLAGGAYLFFHESVAAVRASTPELRLAAERLNVVLPNRPAIALVVGYDHRAGDRGPSRSDTIMLARVDPQKKAISLLSFPRDLHAPITCGGGVFRYTGRINAAYAECGGPTGPLETVRALTNLRINYLITVNFRAFKQVVNKLGGVWVDVDRRYFNDNEGRIAGFNTYATIDLQPGYQLLNGSDALDFVRYRHSDNDLYRNARQQLFVRAVKQRVSASFGPTSLPKLVGAITQNIEVAKGGSKQIDPHEVLEYALLAYGLPPGHLFQTKIEGLVGANELYAPPGEIAEAVQEFVNPDVEAADKAAAAAGIRRKARKRSGPRPSQVTVTVLNGNGREGAALTGSSLLAERGYRTLLPPNGLAANAPRSDYFRTQIYFDPSQRRSGAAANQLANLFGSADVHRGIPRRLRLLGNGAMTVVVVGQTFHGTIGPAPVDRTPDPKPPAVVQNPGATLAHLRSIRRRVPFPLQVPRVLEKGSTLVEPIRVYRLADGHKAVRLTFKTSADVAGYWGIQQTDWRDAPILDDKSFRHVIKGRTYDFYFSGPRLHMIVLRENGATYWVVNTLLDTLSNETMIAIAKGLRPLPRK